MTLKVTAPLAMLLPLLMLSFLINPTSCTSNDTTVDTSTAGTTTATTAATTTATVTTTTASAAGTTTAATTTSAPTTATTADPTTTSDELTTTSPALTTIPAYFSTYNISLSALSVRNTGQVYENEELTIVVGVQLNSFANTSVNTTNRLQVILGLPEELNSASWFDFNTTVLYGPDVWVQYAVNPAVTLTSGYSAQFDLGLVSTYNTSSSSPPPRLNFTITAVFALPAQGSQPAQRILNATARWQDVTSSNPSAWIDVLPGSTALVQTIGPHVETMISLHNASYAMMDSGVESGDNITYSVKLSQSSFATAQATAIRIKVTFETGQQAPLTSYVYAITTSVPYATTLSPHTDLFASLGGNGRSISNLGVNDTYEVFYTRAVGDQVKISGQLTTTVLVTYTNAIGTTYTKTTVHTQPVMSIDYTSLSGSNVDMGLEMGVGEVVVVNRVIKLPKGLLESLSLFADFTSSDFQSIPIDMSSRGVISVTCPSYIVFANGTNLVQSASSLSVSTTNRTALTRRKRDVHIRVRRSASSSISTLASFGNLVNPSTNGVSGAQVTFRIEIPVSTTATPGAVNAMVGSNFNGQRTYYYNGASSISIPSLSLTKTVQSVDNSSLPGTIRFNITVSHMSTSSGTAHSVTLTDGSPHLDIQWANATGISLSDSSLTTSDQRTYVMVSNSIANGNSLDISYISQPLAVSTLPQGNTNISASINYRSAASSNTGIGFGPLVASACITRVDVIVNKTSTKYTLAIVCAIVGLAIGAIVFALGILFCVKSDKRGGGEDGCCSSLQGMNFSSSRGRNGSQVTPSSSRENLLAENNHRQALVNKKLASRSQKNGGKGAILDGKRPPQGKQDNYRRTQTHATNGDVVNADPSIVSALAEKNKQSTNRHFDNLDVVSSIRTEERLESDRNEAIISGTSSLLKSLLDNKDLDKKTVDKCLGELNNGIAEVDKRLNSEFQNDMEQLFKSLADNNRNHLSLLYDKQDQEKRAVKAKIRDLPEEEQRETLRLLSNEHEVEADNLDHKLKLEQQEGIESLRKRYAVLRRLEVKKAQHAALDIAKSNLGEEQCDWLMKEHFKNQSMVEKMFDDEAARQRGTLNDKLSKRRAIAEKVVADEDARMNELDTVASQLVQTAKKAKKCPQLSTDEVNKLIEETQEQMQSVKEQFDNQRKQQETALQNKLSERKKKRISDLSNKQKAEIDALDKKNKSSTDDMSCLEERQQLIFRQRDELSALEDEIDGESGEELNILRSGILNDTKKKIDIVKQSVVKTLNTNGMDEESLDKLMKKHNNDLQQLADKQEDERIRQREIIQNRLQQSRRDQAERTSQEISDQQELREQGDNVMRNMMNGQVAISEDERNRILSEHEANMAALENNMTLQKMQQKRLLEQRIAERRNAKMSQLKKIQKQETKKSKQYRDDEEATALLHNQMNQRIDLLNEEEDNVDDYREMEEIREEMLKARTNALREQEVKIGAMMTQMQLDKAKELSKIYEQQKAIHNLKSNLMDDLNEKGILTDPECQKVIEMHQKEQESLNKRLDTQRSKQEKALAKRLEERLRKKEESLSKLHDQQLSDELSRCSNSMAAKLRRVAVKHKHLIEMEGFRNRIEQEISQTLEELKRKNEVSRMTQKHDQEIQFINGLVRLGKFKINELDDVLEMLFPTKSAQEHQDLLKKLCEGYTPVESTSVTPVENDTLDEIDSPALTRRKLTRNQSSLLVRVKSATYGRSSVHPENREDDRVVATK